MAAVSSLTTRSGKPRALSGAAIRMLWHDDGEPTRIGDSLRTVEEGDAHGRRGYFLSGRREMDAWSPTASHIARDGLSWRQRDRIRRQPIDWARRFNRRMRPTSADRELLIDVVRTAARVSKLRPVTVTDAAVVLGFPGSRYGEADPRSRGSSMTQMR